MESRVSTQWLADHLDDPGLTVVDSSWHMPATGRVGRKDYLQGHIPGARFLDIDEVSDKSDPAPHMLPQSAEFAVAMERAGIGSDGPIVVYDNSPLRTAARGWFTLRHYGARNVAILDGGLQKWIAEGRPIGSGEPAQRSASFHAAERANDVVTKQQILGGMSCAFVDARGKPRFEGSEPEPRVGVESGHIPGARNIPYSSLYDDDGTFRSNDQLRRIFDDARADPHNPFVASCGSGVTAAALIFAAHLLGNDETRLYDGSWSEWGADPATPKALGPA
jgi:thiosulfate/3-mercaptopyruvate sulfurtransferase